MRGHDPTARVVVTDAACAQYHSHALQHLAVVGSCPGETAMRHLALRTHVTMSIVRIVCVAVSSLVTACAAEPTSPPPTSASFRALSHDGRALPVVATAFAGDTVRISAASLRFLSADRLRLRYTLLWGQRAQTDSIDLRMVAAGDSTRYEIICDDTLLALCINAGFVGPRFVNAPDWTLRSVGYPFPLGSVRFIRESAD